MSRIKVQLLPTSQVAVPHNAAASLASILSLTTDQQCLAEVIMLQADSNNNDDVQVGDSTVALAKCIKLSTGDSIQLTEENSVVDEDRVVFDLRDIWVNSASAGQLLNVALVLKTDVKL